MKFHAAKIGFLHGIYFCEARRGVMPSLYFGFFAIPFDLLKVDVL